MVTQQRNNLILPIEGLRGISVMLVILYHLELRTFAGGFVGVDIFFVISGFIIGRLLVREFESNKTISITDFYARRARRILPAATLVIIGTVIGSYLFLEPLRLRGLPLDVVSASTFWINNLYVVRSTDYLQSALPPSPLQHFWSLAVEEQFYLIFPALLLGIFRIARNRAFIATGCVAVLIASSLALSAYLTPLEESAAFFLAPTRAWQFLMGAVIPIAWRSHARVPAIESNLTSLVGLTLIVIAVHEFDSNTAYPGLLAVVPTIGALLIVVSASRPSLINQLLSTRFLRIIGARSYVLYLWHWPVVVFAKSNLANPFGFRGIILILVLTTLLTELTHRLIENPFRWSAAITKTTKRSLWFGMVCISGGLMAGGVNHLVRIDSRGGGLSTELKAENVITELVLASEQTLLPDSLNPPLESVFETEPEIYGLGCHDYVSDIPRICTFGDLDAPMQVALVGDSHAAQWFEPLRQIAQREDWLLYSVTRSGCSALGSGAPEGCLVWYQNVWKELKALAVDVVVISTLINGTDYSVQSLSKGLTETRDEVVAIGALPIFILDSPRPAESVPVCLSANTTNISTCTLSRSSSISESLKDATINVFSSEKSGYIDLEEYFCVRSICPVVVGDTVVYRDESHISSRYASILSDVLGSRVKQLLENMG